MKAQQCVKLTGTNHSIELDRSHCRCLSTKDRTSGRRRNQKTCAARVKSLGLRGACRDKAFGFARSCSTFFAGLVAFAQRQDPIPSRTRPSNAEAPMVLRLKTWESRSPPGPLRTFLSTTCQNIAAGWSSPVARQAHNLKAAGSNPAPATKNTKPRCSSIGAFFVRFSCPLGTHLSISCKARLWSLHT